MNNLKNIVNKELVIKKWKNFILNRSDEEFITLTIIFPFCLAKCKFCKYKIEILKNRNQINDWLNIIEKDINDFGLIFKNNENAKINNIYFAGGTPTLLNKIEFERLMNIINNNVDINYNKDYIYRIEGSLETLNLNMIETYKKYKFNKISLGIQSLSNNILLNENRTVNLTIEKKLNILTILKKDFSISVDLIDGLKNYEHKNILEDIKILEKYVDVFFIYGLNFINNKSKFLSLTDEDIKKYFVNFDFINEWNFLNLGEDIKLIKNNMKPNKTFISISPTYPANTFGFGIRCFSNVKDFRYRNDNGVYTDIYIKPRRHESQTKLNKRSI